MASTTLGKAAGKVLLIARPVLSAASGLAADGAIAVVINTERKRTSNIELWWKSLTPDEQVEHAVKGRETPMVSGYALRPYTQRRAVQEVLSALWLRSYPPATAS
jgi:hypothetical protein